jgi:hypothetical protein
MPIKTPSSGATKPDPMFSENLRGLTCAAHCTHHPGRIAPTGHRLRSAVALCRRYETLRVPEVVHRCTAYDPFRRMLAQLMVRRRPNPPRACHHTANDEHCQACTAGLGFLEFLLLITPYDDATDSSPKEDQSHQKQSPYQPCTAPTELRALRGRTTVHCRVAGRRRRRRDGPFHHRRPGVRPFRLAAGSSLSFAHCPW